MNLVLTFCLRNGQHCTGLSSHFCIFVARYNFVTLNHEISRNDEQETESEGEKTLAGTCPGQRGLLFWLAR